MARNLQNLAKAAQNFHSAASSTASTIRDGSSVANFNSQPADRPDVAMSVMGDLSAFRRERIEMFIRGEQQSGNSPATRLQSHTSILDDPILGSLAPGGPDATQLGDIREDGSEDAIDEFDIGTELELLFASGHEELALDRMKNKDYEKATSHLKEAIQRQTGCNSEGAEFRKLQILLAICYFFQNRWRLAEPIVARLAASSSGRDLVVCTLLHALSISHLSNFSFEGAVENCKRALHSKRRLLGAASAEYGESMRLLAAIYEMTGDYMRAEVLRRHRPGENYEHPKSAAEYIAKQARVFQTILGGESLDFGSFTPEEPTHDVDENCFELDAMPERAIDNPATTIGRCKSVANGSTSILRNKLWLYEKLEVDTSKEVVLCDSTPPESATDADGEGTPITLTPSFSLKRRLTKMFSVKRVRHISSDETLDTLEDKTLPSRRWFKGVKSFSLRKSRTLLRKQPNETKTVRRQFSFMETERPQSFRLLKMEKLTEQEDCSSTDTIAAQCPRVSFLLVDDSSNLPKTNSFDVPGIPELDSQVVLDKTTDNADVDAPTKLRFPYRGLRSGPRVTFADLSPATKAAEHPSDPPHNISELDGNCLALHDVAKRKAHAAFPLNRAGKPLIRSRHEHPNHGDLDLPISATNFNLDLIGTSPSPEELRISSLAAGLGSGGTSPPQPPTHGSSHGGSPDDPVPGSHLSTNSALIPIRKILARVLASLPSTPDSLDFKLARLDLENLSISLSQACDNAAPFPDVSGKERVLADADIQTEAASDSGYESAGTDGSDIQSISSINDDSGSSPCYQHTAVPGDDIGKGREQHESRGEGDCSRRRQTARSKRKRDARKTANEQSRGAMIEDSTLMQVLDKALVDGTKQDYTESKLDFWGWSDEV
jgi:hypothetical protein